MYETHNAPRSQNTPHPEARPGFLAEPPPLRSDRSLRRLSENTPLLGVPSLADASAQAIDGRTFRFLLEKSLARKKKRRTRRGGKWEEKEMLKAVKEEEEEDPDGWLQAFDSGGDLHCWHRRTRRALWSPAPSAPACISDRCSLKPQFVEHLPLYRSTAAAALSGASPLHGKLCDCVMFQDTPSQSRSQSRIGCAMAFTRINCDTTTVTHWRPLQQPHCRFVCVRCSSQSSSQDGNGRYFPQCLILHAALHGQALCHLSRHISQSHPPRRGSTAVLVRGMSCHMENAHHLCAESVGRE